MEERRLKGGRLLKEKRLIQAEIARELGVSRAAVGHRAKLMRSGVLKRLQGRKPTGRQSKLSRSEERRLLSLMKRGAQAAGFPTDRWTLKRIQQLIWQEFEVDYHPNYINRLMRRLNWSWQQPLPQAIERDEAAIAIWREQDWPRIKKRAGLGLKSCFSMNLAFPFKNRSGALGLPAGNDPSCNA